MNMTIEIKQSRNTLGFDRRLDLYEFLKSRADDIASRGLHANEVAQWATKDLGFEVSYGNVLSLMGDNDRARIKHDWPGRPSATRKGEDDLKGQITTLISIVDGLNARLGRIEKELGIEIDLLA